MEELHLNGHRRNDPNVATPPALSTRILDVTPESIVVTRLRDDVIVEASSQFAKTIGFRRNELLGRPAKTIGVWNPDPAGRASYIEELRTTGSAWNQNIVVQCRDGELKHCLISGQLTIVEDEPYDVATVKDITVHRQVDIQYREVFEASPCGLAICKLDGYMVEANASLCTIFGYTHSQFLELRPDRLFPLEVQPEYEQFQNMVRAGGVVTTELLGLHKDGHTVQIEMKGCRLTYAGEPHILMMVRDISDRKRGIVALRQSEERCRLALDASDIGTWEWTFATGEMVWSDKAKRIFGLTPDLFDGRYESYWKVVHPSDRKMVEDAITQALEYNSAHDEFVLEHRVLRSDGTVRWVRATGRVYRDVEGTPVMMFGTVHDTTDRVTAKRELAQHEELLQQIIYASPHAIYLKDREGHYIMANKSAAGRFGLTPERLLGRTDLDVAHLDDIGSQRVRSTVEAERRAIDRRVPAFIPEEQFTYHDGHTGWFQSTKIPITLGDHGGCIVGISVDISARKTAEEELQRMYDAVKRDQEALEEKNIALRQILSYMDEEKESYRHEICDAVAKLIMPVLEQLEEESGSVGKNQVAVLRNAVEALVHEDLDVFASNMGKLTPRELDVCELIKQGLASKEIAEKLNLSIVTVHKHRDSIRRKLQINNRSVNLAAYLRSR